jgi:hypothetical protein
MNTSKLASSHREISLCIDVTRECLMPSVTSIFDCEYLADLCLCRSASISFSGPICASRDQFSLRVADMSNNTSAYLPLPFLRRVPIDVEMLMTSALYGLVANTVLAF